MAPKHSFLFFVFLIPFVSIAQIPANPIGINPPKLKWRQIETDKVQVIFPDGLESQGQRVANIAHYLWDEHDESVGEKDGKVSILLQNQTAISNGFVTVGPFRSEFYMTPPQFDVTTDWLDILTIHEYRHVKQFVNSQRGVTKLVKNILGSWAWGGLMATALPRWYFEGDATAMETVLTNSGRGRFPSFNMEYRSLVLEGKRFGYEKAGAGSLKEFVPNWYPLGYYMTSYARARYGEHIWATVVDEAVQYKGLFFPFSRSLKKQIGLSTKDLYEETRNDLDNMWRPAIENNPPIKVGERINSKPKKTVVNYNNPKFTDNGQIIVQKSAFNELPAYYSIDEKGIERKIVETGILLDQEMSTLSFANQTLCWAELAFHPRWQNKTYSIIRTYNLATGKKTKITPQSRYFAPALSPNGQQIVAVEISESLAYQLVILNSKTGEVQTTLPNPENIYFIHPQWAPDGQSIFVIAKQNEKHSLQRIYLESGAIETIIPPSYVAMSHPTVSNNILYFSGALASITNDIFAVELENNKIYKVAEPLLGAFQPAVSQDSSQLIYSDFSSGGYNVRRIAIDRSSWTPIPLGIFGSKDTSPGATYEQVLNQQEHSSNGILGEVPNEQFNVKKFNKLSGIINPHSVLPFINPPIAGATLLSDNKFSTLSAQVGGFYNYNEDEWSFIGDVRYAEFFPVIRTNFTRSNRSANFFNFNRIQDTSIVTTVYSEEWAENDFSVGLEVPLTFSQGNFFNSLNLSADYHFIQTFTENIFDSPTTFRDTLSGDPRSVDEFAVLETPVLRDENLQAISLRARFVAVKRQARQHLNPRLGVVLDASYRTLLNSAPIEGDVLLFRGDLYLPGIGKNHSFVINTMYQQSRFLDNYKFSNRFFYPRGHDSSSSDDVFKIGVNYAIPLWYPDLAIGPIAFLKRVKSNFFYDYAQLSTGFPFSPESLLNSDISSAGVELTFDARFFRLLEVDLGIRYSYLVDPLFDGQERHQFDFLLISISE